MIVGLGSDLSDIRRIEKTLERHGERFTQRIFTGLDPAIRRMRVLMDAARDEAAA